MENNPVFFRRFLLVCTLFLVLPGLTSAQANNVPSRIIQAVDGNNLTLLKGNTHPLARLEFDRGPAPPSLPMERMLLVLKRSPEQESALKALLDEQQDKSSPNYHQWLTLEQFGQQFGPSDQDIQTITAWLGSHGFQVARVAKGRTVIEFSGTAGQVQEALHTSIHKYTVNGEDHWANSSDPQIPAALTPVVASVDTLHNFPRKTMNHIAGVVSRTKATGEVKPVNALFTLPSSGGCGVQSADCYAVGPYDFATIYNVLPLWNPTTGSAINGTGQTIAIVGDSDINPQDIADFRKFFGMAPPNLTVFHDGSDPGILLGAETESDLDVEWSGAVAPGAMIYFVVAAPTTTTLGVDLSAEYIIDNNLAPIMSVSYGECELFLGTAGNAYFNALWQQAAAQGITVFVASGDSGSAVCDSHNAAPPAPAKFGLAVSGFSSTPYNIAVGGTDFFDLTNASTYWNLTNNATTLASAKSYVPETTWNDTCTNPVFGTLLGYSTNAEANCNNPQLEGFVLTVAGSGGKSNCISSDGQTVASCSGGYPKPAWQVGPGVPSDGNRDVPDVSLFAAAGSPSGSFYVLCEVDALPSGYSSCDPTNPNTYFLSIGGTSASSPAMAGIMALVNQKMGAPQGNANYVFYKLAAQQTTSNCNSTGTTGPASTCVFNDVTTGTIAMPCLTGSTADCQTSTPGDAYGVLTGYSTASGYDLATGLGSVNAENLVNTWSSVTGTFKATTTTLTSLTPTMLTHGQSVNVNIGVAPTTGTGTPTGQVSLMTSTGQSVTDFTLSAGGSASGSTKALPGGTYSVTAHYPGDGTFAASDSAPVSVAVSAEASKTIPSIVTFDPTTGKVTSSNATSFSYGSPYILRADVTNSSGTSCFNSTTKTRAYGCPTGIVTLADNGTALGSGTFALNSEAYTEYQTIQLTGGSHTLTGNYSGDASYNASTGTDPVTVTPAPTTTAITSPPSSTPPQTELIGSNFSIFVQTVASSSGVAPTGTFTVFDGSTQLSATVLTNGFTTPNTNQVFLNGTLQTALSAPSGPHTLTVHYAGDANYGGSVSTAVTVDALYSTTATLTATPNSIIYGQGTNVTLTATISTGNPASNALLKPTGTVSFGLSGTPTTTVAQDSNGNWTIQATLTFTPTQSGVISAQYSGDSNYASSSASVGITVTLPAFNFSANSSPMVITAGQTGTTTLTITPQTNYTSTVSLSCYGQKVAGGTCTISPSSVTLMNGVAATATLSIATLAPSATTTAMTVPNRMRGKRLVLIDRDIWWFLSASAALTSLLLFITSKRRPSWRTASGMALVCLLSFAMGCGGGNGNGNGSGSSGGSGPTGPVPTTTAVSTTSVKLAAGASATLTATVRSSNSPTGYVSFNDASFPYVIASYVSLLNGTAQAQFSNSGSVSADPGTHVINAQYLGDTNNQASQSGNLNVVITGSTQQLVIAQTSGTVGDNHDVEVNVTIQ